MMTRFGSTMGLKHCHHTKDNRFGHTVNTEGFTASGFPICMMFEWEGETQTEVYVLRIKRIFGARTGGGSPNLTGILNRISGEWWCRAN